MDDRKIDITGTEHYDYDDWLEFFRKQHAEDLVNAADFIKKNTKADAYAALLRWFEIFEVPSKMDKLHKGRLDKRAEDNIMDIAVGDDDEAFYEALIRQNTTQLNSSSVSQQEVARLSQNINIFRKELREIRSRKPKSGSTLEKVLAAASAQNKPKTRKARKTPAKTPKKTKSTPVKSKKTASKAAKASKAQKLNKVSMKAKK